MKSSTRPAWPGRIPVVATFALSVAWYPAIATAGDNAAVAKAQHETGVRDLDSGRHDPVDRRATVSTLHDKAELAGMGTHSWSPIRRKIACAA
jgi:hypothetical protein